MIRDPDSFAEKVVRLRHDTHHKEDRMDKQAILEKVKTRVGADGKISCEQAMKLADAEGLSYGDMGDLLNEFQVKVGACQLHCFPNPVCSPATK